MTDSQRKHDWKEQPDADGDTYYTCQRANCHAIWAPMHDQNAPEPTGCTGQDSPKR